MMIKIGRRYKINAQYEDRQWLDGQIVTVYRCRNREIGTVEVCDDEMMAIDNKQRTAAVEAY